MNKSLSKNVARAILVILALCIVSSLIYAFVNSPPAQSSYIGYERSVMTNILDSIRQKRGISPNDVSYIQSWMTFDYINTIFKLPPQYLEQNLSITSTHYPKISISSFAKHNNMTDEAAVEKVRSVVKDYVANNPGAESAK